MHEESLDYIVQYISQEAVQTAASVSSVPRGNASKSVTRKSLLEKCLLPKFYYSNSSCCSTKAKQIMLCL